MRKPVRKILGVALFGLLAVFVSAPLTAGAQEGGPPPSPGDCVINDVTPNPLPAGGSVLTVSGTAPAGVELQIYYNEVISTEDGKPTNPNATPVATVLVPANGQFSVGTPFVNTTTDVSANYTFGNQNFYATGCSNIAGQVVVRVEASTVVRAAPLAFTGSSNTPTFVLIGLGAVIIGVVFVVASRRRARVHG